MPDYEVIMCNNVFGFAYKYEGDKWIKNKLGLQDEQGHGKRAGLQLPRAYKQPA